MTEIDLALRAAAGALIAASIALLLVHRTLPARLGALFAAGVGVYLVCSAPGFAALPQGVHLAFVWACVANPVLFWLFARALFDDEFSPGVSELAAFVVVEAMGLVRVLGRSHMPEWLDMATFLLLQAMNLTFIAHAMVLALSGRAGDLIEERRRFRVFFVAAVGTYMAAIAAAELILWGSPPPAWLSLFNAAGICLLSFAALVHMATVRQDRLLGALLAPARRPTPMPLEEAPGELSQSDQKLLAGLTRAMAVDRLHLTEGLTIGKLADTLGTEEYRLRRLINQHLGYRNFAAFLNSYRLADAKRDLLDPAKSRLPILTVALDLGFGSIGPFNRAFKVETGLTPSEYRRRGGLAPLEKTP